MHILHNISRSKDNKTIKFGQLIEYKKRNIFFLINCKQNMVENLLPDYYLKNQNWANLYINNLSFMQFVFIVCQVEGYKNIFNLSCRPFAFTSNKAFLRNKMSPKLIFCMIFEGKYFCCYILLADQISLSGCFYFVKSWAICVLQLFVNSVVTS